MIPPWCVQRMTEVFCEEQGEGATGTFRTLGVSGALNAAVAVAAETANAPPAARGRGFGREADRRRVGQSVGARLAPRV